MGRNIINTDVLKHFKYCFEWFTTVAIIPTILLITLVIIITTIIDLSPAPNNQWIGFLFRSTKWQGLSAWATSLDEKTNATRRHIFHDFRNLSYSVVTEHTGSIPGCRFQSPTPKPLGHTGTWTTQSLTLGSFVTQWWIILLRRNVRLLVGSNSIFTVRY